MDNPVVLPDGWTYEKTYIDDCFSKEDPEDLEGWDLLDGSELAYRQGDAAHKDRKSHHDPSIRMKNEQIPNLLLKRIIEDWHMNDKIDPQLFVVDSKLLMNPRINRKGDTYEAVGESGDLPNKVIRELLEMTIEKTPELIYQWCAYNRDNYSTPHVLSYTPVFHG
jgi:hypothetical protein